MQVADAGEKSLVTTFSYVILGGGMVAGYAAKELVARGLRAGELCIVSADSAPPYERPPLSKGFLAERETEDSIFINDAAFYREHSIKLRLNTPVERIEPQQKRLRTRDGEEIGFEKLLIATGSHVRTLTIPGANLDGICYLRTLDDAKHILTQQSGARRAAVIGGGFIGMEVASVLAQRGMETRLIFPEERVWKRFFTPVMSAFFERYYQEHGITLVPQTHVVAIAGDRRVAGVELDSGATLPVDLVVAGIGVLPGIESLTASGIDVDNGVIVNEYLETSTSGVYAAGDVANYYDVLFEKRRRVEHWDNAVEQGKHAARLLTGERKPFVHVPYFFSNVFDLMYEFWGDAEGADQVSYRGDVDSGRFSAWWTKEGRLIAAFVLNRPDEERDLAPQWIANRQHITPAQVENTAHPLRETMGR